MWTRRRSAFILTWLTILSQLSPIYPSQILYGIMVFRLKRGRRIRFACWNRGNFCPASKSSSQIRRPKANAQTHISAKSGSLHLTSKCHRKSRNQRPMCRLTSRRNLGCFTTQVQAISSRIEMAMARIIGRNKWYQQYQLRKEM